MTYEKKQQLKEWLWKITKSILIASGAAALGIILQYLEVAAAQDHPMLVQAVLSVVIAGVKQAVKLLR